MGGAQDHADVALHADAVDALATALARALGARRLDAFLHVLHRPRVGEEKVLDAGADGARGDEGARLLGYLHHGGHVREELHGARYVLQRVHVVWT